MLFKKYKVNHSLKKEEFQVLATFPIRADQAVRHLYGILKCEG